MSLSTIGNKLTSLRLTDGDVKFTLIFIGATSKKGEVPNWGGTLEVTKEEVAALLPGREEGTTMNAGTLHNARDRVNQRLKQAEPDEGTIARIECMKAWAKANEREGLFDDIEKGLPKFKASKRAGRSSVFNAEAMSDMLANLL